MKLSMTSIAVLVAAGTISSIASANSEQLSKELAKLDQKATAGLINILQNEGTTESEKVAQVNALLKKVDFAKQVEAMRLQPSELRSTRVGSGMTCGDYNL